MGHAYDRQYLSIMKQVATKHRLELQEGIYCGLGASRVEIARFLTDSFHRSQVDLVMKPSLRSICSDNSAAMPWVSAIVSSEPLNHSSLSGMSIVHEVTLAAHCGFRTLGLALITNECLSAYDATVEAVHEDVIRVSELKANELQQLVLDFVGILKANQV